MLAQYDGLPASFCSACHSLLCSLIISGVSSSLSIQPTTIRVKVTHLLDSHFFLEQEHIFIIMKTELVIIDPKVAPIMICPSFNV